MLERGARSFAVVLENEDVFEAAVLLQVEDAVAEGPEYVLDALGRQRSQRRVVVGRFDDHLVRADAVHLVEHAFGLAAQIAFDAQRGELVGHYADGPAGSMAAAAARLGLGR